jgi:serine protease Do
MMVLLLGLAPARAGEAVVESSSWEGPFSRVGVKFRSVTPEETAKFNLNPGQGVVIVWVDPMGAFGRVGFEAGDVILEVNQEAIENLENFVDLLNSFKPHRLVTLLAIDHQTARRGYVQVVVR